MAAALPGHHPIRSTVVNPTVWAEPYHYSGVIAVSTAGAPSSCVLWFDSFTFVTLGGVAAIVPSVRVSEPLCRGHRL
jgi:hypothetical protein